MRRWFEICAYSPCELPNGTLDTEAADVGTRPESGEPGIPAVPANSRSTGFTHARGLSGSVTGLTQDASDNASTAGGSRCAPTVRARSFRLEVPCEPVAGALLDAVSGVSAASQQRRRKVVRSFTSVFGVVPTLRPHSVGVRPAVSFDILDLVTVPIRRVPVGRRPSASWNW